MFMDTQFITFKVTQSYCFFFFFITYQEAGQTEIFSL